MRRSLQQKCSLLRLCFFFEVTLTSSAGGGTEGVQVFDEEDLELPHKVALNCRGDVLRI